jgi:S-adenosylmethionine:tRNA ribosyltransferase-isomerase
VDLDELDYDLPPASIAQCPADARDASRLLVIDRLNDTLEDRTFRELPELLRAGDCLVVNDSRVLPARLFARDAAGTAVELLFVEPDRTHPDRWRALVRPGRRARVGAILSAEDGAQLTITAVGEDGERVVATAGTPIPELLTRHGRLPLPPYIRRHADPETVDQERYQTVYARAAGSIAAPTAGLHFTDAVLARLRARGVEVHALTLHVGPATFRPIRTPRVEEHRLPPERVTVPAPVAAAVNRARAEGRRVVAVGTTVTRTLEGLAADDGQVASREGTVELFIVPGHRFRVVDALITNFHVPRSSLLVLVSAFAGRERILKAYRHALDAGYRFYSYGDACLIT